MILPHAPFSEAQRQMPETVEAAGQTRRGRNRYFTIRPEPVEGLHRSLPIFPESVP
ncbi:hypothetical protein sS8_4365 [Methylocaldum marinum]|uniref:Uncharacterized protein n=1 Tax=Methylocaldum marinum TaxID=1432792 RepID=A0A250KXE3_9GAMM|nr:hypothetical protein sS8_4365 [Methylocaldum marinum]